ncbi:MAG TPA: TIR domain-containing protein, partial [Pyrinomonadaceae bacterium]|nr:TIR domain-containing protein [Pyrinomonadaceae bacterium]
MSLPANKKFSGIFVSYRREDSAGHAGRLFDRLVEHFGRERIFMDIDTIEPGEDFVTVIDNAVSSCDVLIAIIGRNWLTTSGTGRLDKPNDFVRIEIATALRRDIRVIPVLVQRASIPKPQDLPEDLVKLTRRNAVELSDLRWQSDVEQLIAVMERVLANRSEPRPGEGDEVHELETEPASVTPASTLHERPRTLVTQASPSPFYKNRKLMLIAGVSLLVLLATAIFLWRSQRDETISGNFQSSLAPQPSVTEQPVSETPTPTPAEAKKPPVEIELIFVPAGSFKMGAEDGFDNEQPVHEVTFSEGFYMGKYEVTQAQWQAVVGDNPSHFQNCDNGPVENVSWVDVHRFLEKLNDG